MTVPMTLPVGLGRTGGKRRDLTKHWRQRTPWRGGFTGPKLLLSAVHLPRLPRRKSCAPHPSQSGRCGDPGWGLPVKLKQWRWKAIHFLHRAVPQPCGRPGQVYSHYEGIARLCLFVHGCSVICLSMDIHSFSLVIVLVPLNVVPVQGLIHIFAVFVDVSMIHLSHLGQEKIQRVR